MKKYLDMSLILTEDTPVYPGEPEIVFKQHAYCSINGFNEHQITINTHFGTHIDFPFHMLNDGKKSNEFSIDNFIGKGCVVDVNNPQLVDADVYLLYTNHMEKGIGNLFKDISIIDDGLIDSIIARKPKMVLLDIPTPDKDPYPIHKKLLSQNILIVENVCNMKELFGKQFNIFVMPLNFDGFDGSPCRVFAEIL